MPDHRPAPPDPVPSLGRARRQELVRSADRWADALTRTASEGLDLVLPRPCASCGRGAETLCPLCAALFHRFTARPADVAPVAPAWPDELPCTAAGVYAHEVARAVLAWENHGRRDLAPVLGRALGRALGVALADGSEDVDPLLVPVPSSRASCRRRGFSPAEELARRVAPEGMRVCACLRRRESFLDRWPVPGLLAGGGSNGGQKGLGARQRRDRMHGSLALGFAPPRGWLQEPAVAGRACLLVDDVVTTGASLREAARVLAAAGAEVRGAVVLAAVRAPVRGEEAVDRAVSADREVGRSRALPT